MLMAAFADMLTVTSVNGRVCDRVLDAVVALFEDAKIVASFFDGRFLRKRRENI